MSDLIISNSGVYTITNTVNGKVYVGSSINTKKRFTRHLYDLKVGCHRNEHLQRSFDKYGESSFVFEVLEKTAALLEREQHHIDLLKPEYNILQIAGRATGYKHSEAARAKIKAAKANFRHSSETIERIRLSKIGRIHSEETLAKMRQARKGTRPSAECLAASRTTTVGRSVSDETRAKMRAARLGKYVGSANPNFGKSLSIAHRKKISDANRGKVKTLEMRQNMANVQKVPVERISLTGEIVWYPSQKDTEKDGFRRNCVSQCCTGIQKSHKDYQWRYAGRSNKEENS